MTVPHHFMHTDVYPVKCIEIKVPVVVGAIDVQIVIDNHVTMPELAIKVDRIVASVRDLKGTVVFVEENTAGDIILAPNNAPVRDVLVKKIIVSGTLHKQVFYVNKNNEVRHFSEDIPFTKMVDLPEPRRVDNRNDVFVQFHNSNVDVNWELTRASKLHQTAVIIVTAKAVEDKQIFVQTCPRPKVCPPGNLVRDGGLEVWADETHPVFWGASNVVRTTRAASGSFAAELGRLNPLLPAALFQMVSRGVVGGRQYRLTFKVKEDVLGVGVSNFTLLAEVLFFDEFGVQVGVGAQTLPSTSIPETAYTQVQFVTPRTDENVASAMVRFSFNPAVGNTNTVKIDDVVLECVPM